MPALQRIIVALARLGLVLPDDVRDADELALLVSIAVRNRARGRQKRAVRLSLTGASARAWDESKHPRGQPENAGEFAPTGRTSRSPIARQKAKPGKTKSFAVTPQAALPAGPSTPAPAPKATSKRAQLHGRRGRFLHTGTANPRRPGPKETHAAVLAAEIAAAKALEAVESANAEVQRIGRLFETALERVGPDQYAAHVQELREQLQTAKEWARHQSRAHSTACARVRAVFADAISKRVRKPAKFVRSDTPSGCPFTQPLGDPSPGQQAVFDAAHAFLEKVVHWDGDGPPPYQAELSSDGRAFCMDGIGQERFDQPLIGLTGEVAHLPEYERSALRSSQHALQHAQELATKTHIHELGHLIEWRKPGVQQKARAFVERRTAGEKPVKLKDRFPRHTFEESEEGRADDFAKVFDPFDEGKPAPFYAGKVYPDGATEVVAMGLEQLFDDPGHFARADPEYFQFMVRVLTR